MSSRHETASNLASAIQRHSPEPLSEADAVEAAYNLAGLFELLLQIKKETQPKR